MAHFRSALYPWESESLIFAQSSKIFGWRNVASKINPVIFSSSFPRFEGRSKALRPPKLLGVERPLCLTLSFTAPPTPPIFCIALSSTVCIFSNLEWILNYGQTVGKASPMKKRPHSALLVMIWHWLWQYIYFLHLCRLNTLLCQLCDGMVLLFSNLLCKTVVPNLVFDFAGAISPEGII